MDFLMIHKSDGHSIFVNKNEIVSIEEIMTFGGARTYITTTTGKEIETNEEIEALMSKLKIDYNKTIWHKVTDDDLPAVYHSVLVAIKRTMKNGDSDIFTTIGVRTPYTIDTITWNISGQYPGDEIIAWTELPEYNTDNATFVPMKAFIEPKIPDTVEPLGWEKVFPELKSK